MPGNGVSAGVTLARQVNGAIIITNPGPQSSGEEDALSQVQASDSSGAP